MERVSGRAFLLPRRPDSCAGRKRQLGDGVEGLLEQSLQHAHRHRHQHGRHSVTVLDADGNVLRTIPVGQRPWGLALTADGSTLYTANGASNDVSVVDTRSGTVRATVPAGDGPWGVAVQRTRVSATPK